MPQNEADNTSDNLFDHADVAVDDNTDTDTDTDTDTLTQPADDPDNKTVVAVKMRYNPKTYWFDPDNSTYNTGQHVLVETQRGREVALVVNGALKVPKASVDKLKSPLKPVLRALTELDYDHIDVLDEKGREAMPIFREYVEKHGLDVNPVGVEYMFSGEKAVFYFVSEERVDFRSLVRDLASYFHIRVDMRQIGPRDQACMVGGFAHCGEELCCTRLGGQFQPVSIRMAKEQDLPLNPAKISGACGRLMCCLRYEYEAYKDFRKRAPKKGSLINTPLGMAKVTEFNTPREMITMRLEDGKQMTIPLAELSCKCDKDGHIKGCCASRDVCARYADSAILLALDALARENDELGDIESQKYTSTAAGNDNSNVASHTRRKRRRTGGKSDDNGSANGTTSGSASGKAAHKASNKPAGNKGNKGGNNGGNGANDSSKDASSAGQQKGGKRRNRRRKRGQGQGQDSGQNAQRNQDQKREQRDGSNGGNGNGGPKLRPGRNSSGLRNPRGGAAGAHGNAKPNGQSNGGKHSKDAASGTARSNAGNGVDGGNGANGGGAQHRRRRRHTA
ncbi:MAG: hypothetical protein LBM21_01005 [Coriobacteriales bacterium]|jgi:cell fate regulator YaaT (PSP1 superfamily)|nr:hypothetical protein [Coriobacteriales bacterium]